MVVSLIVLRFDYTSVFSIALLFGFVALAAGVAVLALIAAFALVIGVSELVVAIGGKEILERKAKQKFGPKTKPQPSHDTRPRPARDTDVELAMSPPARRVPTRR
jgi:hypothetical protein